MNEEKLMCEEAFNEIINSFEIVGTLTEYGRKNIKHHVQRLQQERNNYKELYEKEISKKEKLKEWLKEQDVFITELPAFTKEISIEHKTMAICYENTLDKMEDLERL